MTEYETIYLASEYINRTWGVMQFWASISFGLIALTHFASKYINLIVSSGLTILFIAFTVFVVSILKLNGTVVDGFIADLAQLSEAGKTSSQGTKNILQSAPGKTQMLAIITVFFGTFTGVLSFLWYTYFKERSRSRNNI